MTVPVSGQARLILCEAFERFKATVTLEDKREFADTTLKDVREEAIKIEKQLRARHTQKNIARLQPFLQGMEHYSKVVEVLCNGTPYLSWIWAPVKLMLMITVDSLSAFEKLIDAYGKIGDMLPRFDRLASALSHDSNFQAALALLYADILEFHRRAYKFVRRRSWTIFFGSMWAGFQSRFDNILRSIAYHTELVEKEAVAIDIFAATALRNEQVQKWGEQVQKWEQQEREWQALKVRNVLAWLATVDRPVEDVLERNTRECLPRSCDWFLQHRKIQLWLKDGPENPILWLYGKPGAGKSVLSSSLVEYAEAQGTNIFYYFCSYLASDNDSSTRLLRSLALQIIQKHQDLAIHVHEEYAQSHPVPSKRILLSLLAELLQGLGSVRFVIDGIDEWAVAEQKGVLRDLTQTLFTDTSSCIYKIMIASRDTLEIARALRKKGKVAASISLSDSDESYAINRAIGSFVDDKLSELPDHFDELDPDALVLAGVKRALLAKSNGMFLWVRLVLDSLEGVYGIESLRNLVDDLPSDLETLYERIFHRLCNSNGPRLYGGVPRMLAWVCFSQRPLHKHELLHGLAILPGDQRSDAQSVPVAQILDHCKPFIEERSDSTIVLVHFSIKEFLLKYAGPPAVGAIEAHMDVSFACVMTLIHALDLLRPNAGTPENRARIATGRYRLLPYALTYWIEHCLTFASEGGLASPNHLLSRLLTELVEQHDRYLPRADNSELFHAEKGLKVQLDDRLTLMAHLPVYELMKGVLHVRWLTDQQQCKKGEDAEAYAAQKDSTLFSKLATHFETIVIYLLSQDQVANVPKLVLEEFHKSYASTAFRCRFPTCEKSFAGFPSSELRSQHENMHFRRINCKVADCRWSRIGFKDKSGLDAHTRKYHNEKSLFLIPPKVRRPPGDRKESERKDQTDSKQHGFPGQMPQGAMMGNPPTLHPGMPSTSQSTTQQPPEAAPRQTENTDIGQPFGSLGDEDGFNNLNLGLGDDSALENFDFDKYLHVGEDPNELLDLSNDFGFEVEA